MILHTDVELFKNAIRSTSKKMDLSQIYIEKDYWICYSLNSIYISDIKDQVIFKGGTSLSKCYRIIERFSEDLDLVVSKQEGESNNQLKKKLKQITSKIPMPLKEVDIRGVTSKKGMIRKIAYKYPRNLKVDYVPEQANIIVEVNRFGCFEPFVKKEINTYIYEMMIESGQAELAERYGLIPFNVLVLDLNRTFCEKIMSLIRFSNTEKPIEDLKKKIRHIYDIHILLENDVVNKFFVSDNFDTMLIKIANEEAQRFDAWKTWLNQHPKDCLIFKDSVKVWKQLKNTLKKELKDIVFGKLPDERNFLNTILKLGERIQKIYWNVNN